MRRIRCARRWITGWLVLFVANAFVLAPLSWAQTPMPEYVIQPEDTVSVQVAGEPGLTKDYKVDERGFILMDMLGKVKVAGLTAKQAEDRVRKGLSRYLKLFEVDLNVLGEIGARVLVYGEVGKPGDIKLRPGGRLLDALSEAGQPTARADTKRINIFHRATGKNETLDLADVIKDPAKNVLLGAGDTITVPSKEERNVTVVGEVRRPGPQSLDQVKTAYQAIVAAGKSKSGDLTRVSIRAKDSSTPVVVDLSAAENDAAKDDVAVKPGDVITVPAKTTGKVSLRGEVTVAGEREIKADETLFDLIYKGLTEEADRTRVRLTRVGEPERIIDLDKIARDEEEGRMIDIVLKDGDEIFVPTNEASMFVIIGGVTKPGRYLAKPGMTLLDALAMAGNLSRDASKKRWIIAPGSRFDKEGKFVPPPELKAAALGGKKKKRGKVQDFGLIVVSPKKLMKGDPNQNVAIHPGDRILIPEVVKGRPKPGFLSQVGQSLRPFIPFFFLFGSGRGGGGRYY